MNHNVSAASASNEFWVPSQEDWAASKRKVELPNGITMAYTDFGDASGTPLLMIHGYTDNNRAWSLNAPFLTGRRLIAIDLRGHGQSTVTETYSVDELANDVAHFIDKLGLGSVDVIGHSLGSITAQVLAAFYPDKVKSIVLVNSTLKAKAGPGDVLWETVMSMSFPVDPDGELMKEWFWNPTPIDPTFLRFSMEDAAQTDRRVWHGVPRALSTTDLRANPVFNRGKGNDHLGRLGPPLSISLCSKLSGLRTPKPQILTLEGSGHNPNWEHPQKVAKGILKFLDR
nr:esterase [uncultured bacterium]